MIYTEQDIEKAVSNLVSKKQAPIVRHYDGYIILAQNENDFKSKVSKIQRGDTFGFYSVERALLLGCLSKSDIERQIKGYIGLRNMARNHNEIETANKFDKLINDLKAELEEYNCD